MLSGMLLCVTLIGCSGPAIRPAKDGPPIGGPGAYDKIPDATPRAEPLSRYGNPTSYEVFGKRYYVLPDSKGYKERGLASWYGRKFHGLRTSSGEPYDMYGMTAAHRTLPLPTYARVTNLENGRQIIVRINDRGPFHSNRIIDLSYTGAMKLDMLRKGTARVEVEALDPRLDHRKPVEPAPLQVEPELRPTPPPVPVAMKKPGSLYLQAGAFGERSNAQRLRERIRSMGFENVEIHQTPHDRLHRVRLGPFTNASDLQDARQRLIQTGISAQVSTD